MGYAIIRNAKYKMSNMQGISRHNERQNKEYGNEDIDKNKSELNYHLKQPQEKSYEKEFYRLRSENNLKGNLRLTGKKQSNVACEFLITSDNNFFKNIGEAETKRYFDQAYKFASEKCGEKNIISAVVHLDETTPHMHLTYIPVVQATNKKGEEIEKINCSEFWKGFNSYGKLQDDFYDHMKEQGFDLERGQRNEDREERREHMSVQKFKEETLKENIEDLSVKKSMHQEELEVTLQEQQDALRTLQEVKGNIKPLENVLKAIQDEIRVAEDVRVTYHEINEIEGKTGVLSKKKVTIDTTDFEKLKEVAKKVVSLEYSLEKIKDELKRVSNRENRMENFAKKLQGENREFKLAYADVRNRYKDVSEKHMLAKKMLTKYGMSEDATDKLISDTQEKLRAVEKPIKPKKVKSLDMDR